MTRVLHLVPGPDQHGVVRHAVEVAGACGHDARRVERPDDDVQLTGYDVVHVPVTERLFRPDLDSAAGAFAALAGRVHADGAALSVTLHDVPYDTTDFQQRRAAFYRQVVEASRGVVVNSDVELDLVTPWAGGVHSLRRIPLPVERAGGSGARTASGPTDVVVLGFLFPDRGYEQVIAALPEGASLLALGRPSEGHEDLPERYATLAAGRFRVTGFVPDGELGARLRAAAVPVAPNRRVTASGSINTWLAHDRRPLVPDCAYTRELAAARPGALWLYDPDDPAALRAALATALAEPDRTWLGDDVARGPSLSDSADAYAEHLRACVPPRAVAVAGGHTVPGNRWDLLPAPATQPTVSVVVPYFEAQRQLDLVLAGLAGQTYPQDRLEIVVVDDGSRRAPDTTAAGSLAVQVLRQDDHGFRAARARSLGARAASGELLAFLDGDTVPEPDYLRSLLALPAVCPDAVTVGRRRHADLEQLTPDRLAAWRAGQVQVDELDEPAWLTDAYRASDDLLRVDRRSYRYVISAVLGGPAALFAEVGGFDERFVGYGGEDWELAHRLYVAGAVLAHVPGAVAWHDGPDWGARAGADPAAKDPETLMLAALLPDPDARGPGSWWPYPSIVVRAPAMTAAQALATARSAFGAGVDCVLYLDAVTGASADLVRADPRIVVGSPSADVLARAWCVAELTGPADLHDLDALATAADRHGEIRTPALRVRASRGVRRTARHGLGDDDAAQLFGVHDSSARSWPAGDLAARLRPR
ncbi:glycosyltransferase [uncultured Jatrophihabitans sp.]|uniref:glycosyltransferase n=1 Tax=uncultured Jatrophihabitans sp. TaxID=1610747 RepID=UPI0035C977C9